VFLRLAALTLPRRSLEAAAPGASNRGCIDTAKDDVLGVFTPGRTKAVHCYSEMPHVINGKVDKPVRKDNEY